MLVNRKSLVSACLGARHLASRLFIFNLHLPVVPDGFGSRVGCRQAGRRRVHRPVPCGRVGFVRLQCEIRRPRSVHNQIDMDTRSPLIQSLSP